MSCCCRGGGPRNVLILMIFRTYSKSGNSTEVCSGRGRPVHAINVNAILQTMDKISGNINSKLQFLRPSKICEFSFQILFIAYKI